MAQCLLGSNPAAKITELTDSQVLWNSDKVTIAQLPPVIKGLSGCPNLLEFIPAGAVTIEYTQDGGTTWMDYGASDGEKIGICDVLYTGDLYLGKRATSDTSSTSDGLRITIDADTAGVYAMVRYLVVYVNQACKFTLETATRNAPTTFTALYTNETAFQFTAIPMNSMLFGNYNNQNHDTHLRLTLMNDRSGVAYIEHLWMFASQAWKYPSNLARCGHLYKWDLNQNATFPANITASKFIGDLNGTSDKTTQVVDYNDSTKAIKISRNGDAVTSDTLSTLAGFNTEGNIKDIPWNLVSTKVSAFNDTTTLTFTSLDNAGTQLDAILDSSNFAVRYVIGSGFLHDDIYFAMIFRKGNRVVAKLFNHSYPGNDVYFYKRTLLGVATWSGPYWVNPPYSPGKCYLLAESMGEGVDLYGMYLIIELDAGTNETKVVDLSETLGGSTVGVVIDFSYHVDNYLTEFNSVNEYIEIQHGSTIVVNYTTTKSHTVYLKMKFLKGAPQ